MRKLLLFSCLLAVIIESSAGAQAPPPAKPAPTPQATPPTQPPPKTTTPPPTTGAPAPRRATATSAAGRGGLAITATTAKGATLGGVHVELIGTTDREAETDGNGQVNFPGLLAGTYRLRFSGDQVTTFEREVTVRGSSIADVDVMLTPAPEPKVVQVPAPAPQTVAPPSGPKGQPVTMGIVEFLEKEFVGRQPRRESLLSCSGSERATMIQLNDPMPERVYESADAVYYVLGGEGNIQVNGKDTRLGTNAFASVPRGTTHSFSRRGSRSLVLLAVLSGEPCEEAR